MNEEWRKKVNALSILLSPLSFPFPSFISFTFPSVAVSSFRKSSVSLVYSNQQLFYLFCPCMHFPPSFFPPTLSPPQQFILLPFPLFYPSPGLLPFFILQSFPSILLSLLPPLTLSPSLPPLSFPYYGLPPLPPLSCPFYRLFSLFHCPESSPRLLQASIFVLK